MASLLQRHWLDALQSLVASARERLVIAAPFISEEGARCIVESVTSDFRSHGSIELFTDLSPAHVCDGSLDPLAVSTLTTITSKPALRHIPGLHAKVYLSDDAAIITSGNLTANALYRNIECGVLMNDRASVSGVHSMFDDYRAAGAVISMDGLQRYAAIAADIRASTVRQREASDTRLREKLDELTRRAEDELVALRLAGRPVHAVFLDTIRYLLMKHGAMTTEQLHAHIHRLHPDLCDDSVDRVINGESFGKKWKHAVRSAQQRLKKTGDVTFLDGRWALTRTSH